LYFNEINKLPLPISAWGDGVGRGNGNPIFFDGFVKITWVTLALAGVRTPGLPWPATPL